ncbi:MAG: membrane protein [Alphaproteobacteria bacterium]|nr:MAG: membrane protein [Alphaproteobacteria bacterium]
MGPHADVALTLVLAAAFLHATWNAVLKRSGERAVMMGMIAFAHAAVGCGIIAFVAPPAPASWPYILASTVIHWFYYAFLLASYRLGDLSQVYPIARGSAPLLVSLAGWHFAGENLSATAWAGILTISAGIMALWFGSRNGRSDSGAVAAALLTGTTIASYSVIDGLGVRLAGSALGYIGWLFVLEGAVSLFIFYRARGRLPTLAHRFFATGLIGGLLSSTAYGLVIFAATLAPIGPISAVRESSVLIAALIGVILFNERPWAIRLACAAVVVCGILLLTVFA